jgi:ABC-2 type transport system permease protein
MAVYERAYKRYEGETTSRRSRFLILPRYIFKEVFASRWMLVLYAASFIFPLICATGIYIRNNETLLAMFPDFDFDQLISIDAEFFAVFLTVQNIFAFIVTLFVGPALVARDLANNGLPLYFSRPLSRSEYVIGKFSVLAILLSPITWISGLFLVSLQAGYGGIGWMSANLRIPFGIFVASSLTIIMYSLLALSASAWVRWRPVAGFAMLFILLGGGFFGFMVSALFDSDLGQLANLGLLLKTTLAGLLGVELPSDLSLGFALFGLALFVFIFLQLLRIKIRAYEEVR